MSKRPESHAGRALFLGGALALLWTFAPTSTQAQVETDIAGLALENAERYVEPITFGLGYAMGGGHFDSASPMRRYGFDVGVRVAGALPSEASKFFDVLLPGSVTYQGNSYPDPYQVRGGNRPTPSATGEGPGVVLEPTPTFAAVLLANGENPEDYALPFPEGADIPAIPFLVAHGTMGIGWGTEVSLRLIPSVELDEEVGDVSAFGFGVKHSISQWFPGPSPVDLSVWYSRADIKVGDFLDGNANQFGVLVGKGFGPLNLFGTGMMRDASVKVSYTVENPDENPALPADGTEVGFTSSLGSGAVFGVGAGLRLLVMNLSAQYTADEFNTFSVKVGFGIP
jgi:hypothetical protein